MLHLAAASICRGLSWLGSGLGSRVSSSRVDLGCVLCLGRLFFVLILGLANVRLNGEVIRGLECRVGSV